jgi:hypothetical protein
MAITFFQKKEIDKTQDILTKYLDSDFRVFPMAENKTSKKEIEKFEEEIGILLTKEFKAHLLGRFPGIYVEVLEEKWPRPKEYDVGPFWTFLYGLHTFTGSSESDDWMRMNYNYYQMLETANQRAVPILKIIGDADVYCINENSNIVRFKHEENKFDAIDCDFWQLLDNEISELKKRKDRKINP